MMTTEVADLQARVREAFAMSAAFVDPGDDPEHVVFVAGLIDAANQALADDDPVQAHALFCDLVTVEHRALEVRLAQEHHRIATDAAVSTLIRGD